jgi:hypothetical protein
MPDKKDPLKESVPEPAVQIINNIGDTLEQGVKSVEGLISEGLGQVMEVLTDPKPELPKEEVAPPEVGEITTPKELKELTEALERRDKEEGLPSA